MLLASRSLRLLRPAHPALSRACAIASDQSQKVISTIVDSIGDAANTEVPWFMEQMPEAYFRQVAPGRRDAHLRAIVALSSQGIHVPELQLRAPGNRSFTFISNDTKGDSLNTIVERQLRTIPSELGLRRVLLFQSKDGRMGLNMFDTYSEGEKKIGWETYSERRFGEPATDAATQEAENSAYTQIKAYATRLESESGFASSEAATAADLMLSSYGIHGNNGGGGAAASSLALDDYLKRCSSSYVVSHSSTAWLLHQQKALYSAVAGGDDMAVTLTRYDGDASKGAANALLTLAIPQTTARQAILRAILMLNLHGMELQRAQVDSVRDGESFVTLLRAVIRPLDGGLTANKSELLVKDAARLKWVSDYSVGLASDSKGAMDLQTAEVALALADLSLAVLDHPLLSRNSCRERLSKPNILPIASDLAQRFVARFDPESPTSEADFSAELSNVSKAIEAGATGDEQSKQLLRAMASAARHTLRTNVHVGDRWALALRLDPRFFSPILPPVSEGFSNLPHGTFFVAGRHFNGYHNRFRDIARGGLRVVLPPSEEAHQTESRRHFMECFGLSWAQQLKNKDIPEGGSKAVCLVTPQPSIDRTELMHGCVKRMTDAMLDLIVPTTAHRLVTRDDTEGSPLGSELIFLGPDENITPVDLDWIVARAEHRGYTMPSAFMSSKPRAGINHKEYGVTSEGVAVFLRHALQAIGIRPTEEPWSVKLTGGPDGDVAGNMLKILHRDYGDMVRVVGMADGTGCAEDPDGLPMQALLQLFERGAPLAELDASQIGANGALTLADTPAGVAARNTMHNRVVADAFVPAGGRPATMNGSNWKDFLRPDGTPSARVIVEGANLFLTPEARLALFESVALPVVKDSSANKCGVICSSMEIRASMCVSDDAFVALKGAYVPEVLEKLREMANLEASLLFAEAAKEVDTPLPALSERISFAILRVADALSTLMDGYADGRELWPTVSAQLPDSLAHSEHTPQLPQKLPWEYQKSVIVKSLASRLVYREGLAFVEAIPEGRLPVFALAYLEEEERVKGLAAAVAASGHEYADKVEHLLLQGGVRVAAESAANDKAR